MVDSSSTGTLSTQPSEQMHCLKLLVRRWEQTWDLDSSQKTVVEGSYY